MHQCALAQGHLVRKPLGGASTPPSGSLLEPTPETVTIKSTKCVVHVKQPSFFVCVYVFVYIYIYIHFRDMPVHIYSFEYVCIGVHMYV